MIAGIMTQLRQHLADTGMTQATFAKKVGVTQATIAKLCGEKPHISAELAVRIEKATGGIVPVESWPSFEPLRHRTPHAAGCARIGLPECADPHATGVGMASQENRTGPDASS